MNIINLIHNTINEPAFLSDVNELCIEGFKGMDFPNSNFLYYKYKNHFDSENLDSLLEECPVFLVDTDMAGKYVDMPGCDMQVRIPFPEEEPSMGIVYLREELKNGRYLHDKYCNDLLGLYVYKSKHPILKHSIFIWADRCMQAAAGDRDKYQALVILTVLHEVSHYLMNANTYGAGESQLFAKPVCSYIEETYANALSLQLCMSVFSATQRAFIKSFVKRQQKQYAWGWDVYKKGDLGEIIYLWLQLKVLLDENMICDLEHLVTQEHLASLPLSFVMPLDIELYCISRNQEDMPMHMHLCYRRLTDGFVAYSDDSHTWGLMHQDGDIITTAAFDQLENAGHLGNEPVFCAEQNGKWALLKADGFMTGFLYDFIWSFDDTGLCQVAIDNQDDRQYGCVNQDGKEVIPPVYKHLYRFEKGLTPAKLGEGDYCIINDHGGIVVSGLQFSDIRAFRGGYAYCKSYDGRWGLIDYDGKVVEPCIHDSINNTPSKPQTSIE